MGKLTISVDTRDGRPIGILNRDTLETTYRQSEDSCTLSELLQKILKNNWHQGTSFITNELPVLDYSGEYSKHMNFLASSDIDKAYFDLKPSNFKLTNKDRLKRALLFLLGSEVLQGLSRTKQRVKTMFCSSWISLSDFF